MSRAATGGTLPLRSERFPRVWRGATGWGARLLGLIALTMSVVAMEVPLQPRTEMSDHRLIEYVTNEGTWTSVDVSPDGRTVIFDLLGDIYTVPITGGVASVLMGGTAFEDQPRFSPDGAQITFVSDRDGSDNIWVARWDGSDARQLTHERGTAFTSPVWTRDGEHIIVSRLPIDRPAYELWKYSLRSESRSPVLGDDRTGVRPRRPSESLGAGVAPDGRTIVYSMTSGDAVTATGGADSKIMRYDMVSREADVIVDRPGGAFRPLMSPDGRHLVYGARAAGKTGLRLRDLASGAERWLAYPVDRDDQEARRPHHRDLLPGYAFTPDGTAIVVSINGGIHWIALTGKERREVPFKATVRQTLRRLLEFPASVPDGAPVRARVLHDPSQSPDGMRLVFSALLHLYVVELPVGTPRRLTTAAIPEFQPTWSPDGQWIAYVTWHASNGGHVWKVRVDAQCLTAMHCQPVRLTSNTAYYRDVVWSPDGSYLVAVRATVHDRRYVRGDSFEYPDSYWPAGAELVTIAADTTRASTRPLKQFVSTDLASQHISYARGGLRPHFSPDGQHILVQRGPELIAITLDGRERRTHVLVKKRARDHGTGRSTTRTEIRVNPNGRHLLILFRGQLYLVELRSGVGSKPFIVDFDSDAPIRLTDVGVDYFGWADNGRTITWAAGASFFRRSLDSANEPATRLGPNARQRASGVERLDIVLEIPRDTPVGTLVLRGARVITMRGNEVLQDADIVVTGARIGAVAPRNTALLPSDARILDISGTTVIPGFVDTHAHYHDVAHDLLEVPAWPLLANLAYGVTTSRDAATDRVDIITYGDLVEAGYTLGPRVIAVPVVHGQLEMTSLVDAVDTLTKYKEFYHENTIKEYRFADRKDRQFIADAAAQLGLIAVTHNEGTRGGLTRILDGFMGSEHNLPTVPLYADIVQLVAKSGIVYTPTLLITAPGPVAANYFYTTVDIYNDVKVRRFMPARYIAAKTVRRPWARREEYAFDETAKQVQKIVRSGGRVAVGSHGEFQGLSYHWEMWLLASGGLDSFDVLRSATVVGAEAIGYGADLGTIEPGKLADLLVLNRNPLEEIKNSGSIRFVMKNGRLYESDTLNEVWPRQQKLAGLWWHDEDWRVW